MSTSATTTPARSSSPQSSPPVPPNGCSAAPRPVSTRTSASGARTSRQPYGTSGDTGALASAAASSSAETSSNTASTGSPPRPSLRSVQGVRQDGSATRRTGRVYGARGGQSPVGVSPTGQPDHMHRGGGELRRSGRPEPGGQCVGDSHLGSISHPGDVVVWADQHGGGGAHRAEHRQLPLPVVARAHQLNPVSRWSDVEFPGLTEVEEQWPCVVQQLEESERPLWPPRVSPCIGLGLIGCSGEVGGAGAASSPRLSFYARSARATIQAATSITSTMRPTLKTRYGARAGARFRRKPPTGAMRD